MTENDVINMFGQALMIMVLQLGAFMVLFALLCIFFSRLAHKIKRGSAEKRTEWGTHSQREQLLSPEERKGQRGEDLIEKILYETVPGEFQVFRNVYVPHGGATSEIDLVMVHGTGIFVFESKNYNGVISGSMDARNWVHIHPNREKYLFYNPVRQNRNHIRALSHYLQIPETNFYSYVVFSKQCKLGNVPENTRSIIITQAPDLAEQLEDTLSALPALYGAEKVQVIADRIAPLTDVDAAVKAKHIRDIRRQWQSDICPFCGAKLVVRRGKYGDFWGCSRYPRCKFTRQV